MAVFSQMLDRAVLITPLFRGGIAVAQLLRFLQKV
jgi:hypothetical protein